MIRAKHIWLKMVRYSLICVHLLLPNRPITMLGPGLMGLSPLFLNGLICYGA
jgi:hypothetical protein